MTINHKPVLRLMRKLGIQGRIKQKYAITTNSRHNHRIHFILIKVNIMNGIKPVWCSDITSICILTGFVYLAAIIDIYSHRIVRYAIGKTLATKKTGNLIHYCDQGVQYATSADYFNLLKK